MSEKDINTRFRLRDKEIANNNSRLIKLEKTINFHGGINMRFDEFGKFLEKFDKRIKKLEKKQ